MNVTVSFTILGQDFVADVEVRITHPSRPMVPPSLAHAGEPAEACEWEVEEIGVRRNVQGTPKYLSAPAWLTNMIEESDELAEAVAEAERNGE